MNTIELYKFFLNYPCISTDSRSIRKDSIFFALRGENFDGNKFAMDALREGAAYSVIDKSYHEYNDRLIKVEDSLNN